MSPPPPAADPRVRVVLRPLASPFALGFIALAGSALMSAGLDLRWIPGGEQTQVGILILVFTPVPQLVASVFGFLCRDPVAGTGMGIIAASWTARGITLLLTAPHAHSEVLGTLLLVSAAGIAISALEAASGKLVPALVMSTTATHFLLSALQQLAGGTGLRYASGIVGLALTGLALYAAASLALEDLRRKTVLPTGRRGLGRAAMDDDLDGQVADVATEAGVRRQL
ncbi:MAG TPA: hypothetical protein VFT50_17915 [Baekduia sp.]|nr:hypothetical protein [Baekduia sp.]